MQFFFFATMCRLALALTLGIKWPGHEAYYSPASSAEVKNVWSYASPPNVSS
jgi:hypothetical protein